MTKAAQHTEKRYVYKMVDSPVGRLTLVATDEGLAGILWENDRPRRVRLNIEAEDDGTSRARRDRAPARRILCRTAEGVRGEAGSGRNGLSAQGVERTADDPVRRDAILRTDREADRKPRCRARGRRGQRQKSRFDRRAVPPGHRIHRHTHGVRRRARRQETSVGVGRSETETAHLARLSPQSPGAQFTLFGIVPSVVDINGGVRCAAAIGAAADASQGGHLGDQTSIRATRRHGGGAGCRVFRGNGSSLCSGLQRVRAGRVRDGPRRRRRGCTLRRRLGHFLQSRRPGLQNGNRREHRRNRDCAPGSVHRRHQRPGQRLESAHAGGAYQLLRAADRAQNGDRRRHLRSVRADLRLAIHERRAVPRIHEQRQKHLRATDGRGASRRQGSGRGRTRRHPREHRIAAATRSSRGCRCRAPRPG